MKLNHTNLTVTDVHAASAFLERYFGMRRIGGNAGMTFLTDDDGFILSLMKPGRGATVVYPETFHIGFNIGDEVALNALHRRLTEDEHAPSEPTRHHGYTFYVNAPGGFTVELMA